MSKKQKAQELNYRIMDKIEEKDKTLLIYTGCIPSILWYQIITKGILLVFVTLIKEAINLLVSGIDVTKISNSDLPMMFLSGRGIAVLILVLLILVVYAMFDVFAMILLADNVLHQRGKTIRQIIVEAALSLKKMAHPIAVVLVIYLAILAPIASGLYGITLTSSFYIPDFIKSVIDDTPLYSVGYSLFTCGLFVASCVYVFTFHNALFRDFDLLQSMKASRKMVWRHKKTLFLRYVLFAVKTSLVFICIMLVLVIIPGLIVLGMADDEILHRFALVFFSFHAMIIMTFLSAIFIPFQIIEITRLYERCTLENEGEYVRPQKSHHVKFWIATIVLYMALIVVSSATTSVYDVVVDSYTADHNVIAHRAGGTMANENTILGLEAAIDSGVYGSEIDVQRTKDGQYVIFHDPTLQRLCGINATPQDLTLEELRALEIPDTFNSTNVSTQMATLDEFLEGAKDKIHLYIELKGASADDEMAEYVYQKLVEYDMVNQATVICLKYETIEKLKENHPDCTTGYLCYMSMGDISEFNCDELLLEDEMATNSVVKAAHAADKKVFIWTLNTELALARRMVDETDGVITDEVVMADHMKDVLGGSRDLAFLTITFGYTLK